MYVKFVIRRYTKGIPFLLKGIHPIAKTLSQNSEIKGKAKQELIRLIQLRSHGGFICSRYISPLEFSALLSFSFKTIANSNRQIRRQGADAANEFIRLISLLNSYLAFFSHFSKITLLQLQSTPDNSNLQGKSKKRFELTGVQVIGSSEKIAESKVKKQFLLRSGHFNHI